MQNITFHKGLATTMFFDVETSTPRFYFLKQVHNVYHTLRTRTSLAFEKSKVLDRQRQNAKEFDGGSRVKKDKARRDRKPR